MAKQSKTKKVVTPKKVNNETSKRGKKKRSYPVGAFEDSLEFAKEIYKIGVGQKVRKITLFDALGKSPDSGSSRMQITMSGKYGLTKGGYQAEYLELTEKGKIAVSDEQSPVLALKAQFELAIADLDIYNFLFEKFAGNKLPSNAVLIDLLKEQFNDDNIDEEDANIIIETFVVNIKFLGLLQTLAGAERLITLEHALEKIPVVTAPVPVFKSVQTIDLVEVHDSNSILRATPIFESFDDICFYITPIGNEESDFRKHSDLFLESIIIPAMQQFGLRVVRADQIDKPGTITNQIIEYIFKAKLVLADLSFHNPNVFYELALRHACRLPTVQIVRKADRIPFDLSQSRTIIIDTTDIYTLVPKLETYKTEIASQVRQVLANPDSVDNPVTNVFPRIKISIE